MNLPSNAPPSWCRDAKAWKWPPSISLDLPVGFHWTVGVCPAMAPISSSCRLEKALASLPGRACSPVITPSMRLSSGGRSGASDGTAPGRALTCSAHLVNLHKHPLFLFFWGGLVLFGCLVGFDFCLGFFVLCFPSVAFGPHLPHCLRWQRQEAGEAQAAACGPFLTPSHLLMERVMSPLGRSE